MWQGAFLIVHLLFLIYLIAPFKKNLIKFGMETKDDNIWCWVSKSEIENEPCGRQMNGQYKT